MKATNEGKENHRFPDFSEILQKHFYVKSKYQGSHHKCHHEQQKKLVNIPYIICHVVWQGNDLICHWQWHMDHDIISHMEM